MRREPYRPAGSRRTEEYTIQAINITSAVWQDSEVLDAQASAPPRRLARLLTALRASMALATRQYPRGER